MTESETPQSIDLLFSILDDAGKDLWLRKEALQWLRRLKPDFDYDIRKRDSGTFRTWWDAEKKKPDVAPRFGAQPW